MNAGKPSDERRSWTASPEGVAEFVRRHGRPHDPANDYEDPDPFSNPVCEGKSSPMQRVLKPGRWARVLELAEIKLETRLKQTRLFQNAAG